MAAPELICPVCRRMEGGALHVRRLGEVAPGVLGCGCGARFPVIDGVPVVVRDLDAWLASEGIEALRRADLPEACARLLVDRIGGVAARNDALLDVYGRSGEGELQSWLRQRAAALDGDVLEIGAGMGATGRADVVALDLNLALLRRHPARVRVCGDAADPPFLGGRFDAVVLANVLDSCTDPGLVLAQADALLKPGGMLVTTCAYAFQDAVTPRARRFVPEDLAAALRGERALLGYGVRHHVVEQIDRLSWPLIVTDRTRHVHAAQAFVSLKAA